MKIRGAKLESVQVLRAIAAIMVVAHHAFRATTVNRPPNPFSLTVPVPLIELGGIGVDIFFIISGFLMMYISEPYLNGTRSAGHFFVQRIIRIWPPYAVVTVIACFFLWVRSPGTSYDLQPTRLLSLLFIPSFNEKGLLQPIIGPGWSLNYEVMFYACFAASLMLGRRFALLGLTLLLFSIYVLGWFAENEIIHAFFGKTIIFEFLAGAYIGAAVKSGTFRPDHGALWIGAALLTLAATTYIGGKEIGRAASFGVPATLLFIGFLAVDRTVRWPKSLVLLGDASYAIYLVHILLIYRVTNRIELLDRYGVQMISNLVISLTAVVVAVLAGIAFYLFVERPVLGWCKLAADKFNTKSNRPLLVTQ